MLPYLRPLSPLLLPSLSLSPRPTDARLGLAHCATARTRPQVRIHITDESATIFNAKDKTQIACTPLTMLSYVTLMGRKGDMVAYVHSDRSTGVSLCHLFHGKKGATQKLPQAINAAFHSAKAKRPSARRAWGDGNGGDGNGNGNGNGSGAAAGPRLASPSSPPSAAASLAACLRGCLERFLYFGLRTHVSYVVQCAAGLEAVVTGGTGRSFPRRLPASATETR